MGCLLDLYAPPVKARHQPELPFWYLSSDLCRRFGAATWWIPANGGFKKTTGHLDEGFALALQSDPALARMVVSEIMEEYFPESLHADILSAIGLEVPQVTAVAEEPVEYQARRRRDPAFRNNVLRAYEYQCAVTGFQIALGGSFFGCEAAHVKWHAYQGPDNVANGFAVEPTLHKLFDAGAWTLSDDRRILVSAEFTGSGEAVKRIRSLHGNPVRDPQLGEPKIAVEFIQWHREEDLGGVFRRPALPL